MPRRNRVDPFGRIIATPGRGLLMGNRGCLHDDAGTIVRASARDAWISCVPTWPGVRRKLMTPGHYTELFFLDEATAMAAGHRPCGSCRPAALTLFKQAWQRAFGLPSPPKVGEIDGALRSDQPKVIDGSSPSLPDGTLIADDDQAMLRWRGEWLEWLPVGYRRADRSAPQSVSTLTPTRMVAVLRAGYIPLVHPTADQAAVRP